MKVGITTFQRSLSYGAFFQCLALAESLKQIGCDPEVIDYQPDHRRQQFKLFTGGARSVLDPMTYVRGRQRVKFRQARKRWLPIGNKSYRRLNELREDSERFDAIICGSDQIWNAGHTGGCFDPAYFADFGRPDAIHLSYAASLGTAGVCESMADDFRRLTGRLDAISVREESGRQAVASITGRICEVMPDPTLLLGKFDEYAIAPRVPEDFIFGFRLQPSSLFDEILRVAQQKSKCPIVATPLLCESLRKFGRSVVPSPQEWLGLVQRANLVVTNSYHGIVFALLLRRPVIAVALTGHLAERSERLRFLLDFFHTPGVLCSDVGDFERAYEFAHNIDWTEVERTCKFERDRGLQFLKTHLMHDKLPAERGLPEPQLAV